MMERISKHMTFGERLVYTRKKKGLTQKQLGSLVGMSATGILDWEKNTRSPNISMIQKITKALEVSDNWFENDENFCFDNLINSQQDMKLTKEQQQLVADSENLIYFQMRIMHIKDFEEFYGSAAYGLCKAARDYNPSKGSFSTLATLYIRNEILMDKKEWKRSLHPLISIDQTKEFDHGGDTEESIIQVPAEDEFLPLEYKILVESVYQKVEYVLTAKEKLVFRPWLQGKRGSEIAIEMGFKKGTIEKNIRNAKKKCRDLFNPAEIFS